MHTDALVDALKRVLKNRGLTYADVARALALSEASVKRAFAQRSFTLKRLEALCAVLELDFFELAKLARGQRDQTQTLTEAQERGLAARPTLLGVFHLLAHDWQPHRIAARFELSLPTCMEQVFALQRLALVEVLPRDRVRLRVPRDLRWMSDGPIRRLIGERAMSDFLDVRFDEHGGHYRFEYRELSHASLAVLARRLDRLAAEFNELADLDSTLPPELRVPVGLGVGARPWSMAQVTGLRERVPRGVKRR